MQTKVLTEEDFNSSYESPEKFYDKELSDEEEMSEKDPDTGLTEAEKVKIIKKATRASKEAHAYWDPKYEEMEKDWEFFDGTDQRQWSTEALSARGKKRPTLTYNQLPKFVSKVTSESKRNPPSIKLAPREKADGFKADIGMGLVRYIEDSCGAKYAYSHGLQCAAVGGLGWIRVAYDTKSIYIKKVKDPFSWMIDPKSEEANGSDAKYFIHHERKKDGKKILECYEFWWKEKGSDKASDKVFWAIIEGQEILDYGEAPGPHLQIVPVYGLDLQYRDERTVKGIIRDLRDAQSTYNYVKSQELENLATAPKSFVVMKQGTVDETLAKDWRAVNVNIVEIKSNDNANNQTEIPNLAAAMPNISYMQQVSSGAIQDLREISGIYDTALGADSKVMSGAAIVAKSANAEAGQYNFTENLQASIQQVGKIVISYIKPIMGEMSVVRILGEDGKQSLIDFSVPQVDPVTGAPVTLDLNFDDMDISVSSAPAYATRRDAGAQALQDIMTAIPTQAGILADLAVANLDVPGAVEAARRLKMTLPAEMQQADAGSVPQAMMDQVMQASEQTIQEQAAAIEKLKAQLTQVQQQLDSNLLIAGVTQQQKSSTELAKEAMRQAGADRRQEIEVGSKSQSDNKKIMSDAQLQNQKIAAEAQSTSNKILADALAQKSKLNAQKTQTPTSLTISKTEVTPVPTANKPSFELPIEGSFPGNESTGNTFR